MRIHAPMLMALLAGCTAPEPAPAPRQVVEAAGRIAGAPVHCLSAFDRQQFRVSDSEPSALVYGSGKTIWVNQLGPACRFSWNDIPVFEVVGSSYCRGDLVRSIDRSSRIPGPACPLGDFVPYTRP